MVSSEVLIKTSLSLSLSLSLSASSEMCATCSKEDIRVWHVDRSKERLRITVPNMTCNALDIMVDGRSIISGRTPVLGKFDFHTLSLNGICWYVPFP